jgi:hypothetical protein
MADEYRTLEILSLLGTGGDLTVMADAEERSLSIPICCEGVSF